MDISIDKFVNVQRFFIQHSSRFHFAPVFLDQRQVVQGTCIAWVPCSAWQKHQVSRSEVSYLPAARTVARAKCIAGLDLAGYPVRSLIARLHSTAASKASSQCLCATNDATSACIRLTSSTVVADDTKRCWDCRWPDRLLVLHVGRSAAVQTQRLLPAATGRSCARIGLRSTPRSDIYSIVAPLRG